MAAPRNSKMQQLVRHPNHAVQIRGKVTAKDESAGRDENDAGSDESVLDATAREEPRNSRRNSGRGGVEMATPIAPRQTTTTTTAAAAATRLRPRIETRLMAAITLLAEADVSVAGMTARTATADAGTAVTPMSTASTIAPFAYRTSRATTPSMPMLHRSLVP